MSQTSIRRFGDNMGPRTAMYAITFDLDTTLLEQTYGGSSWRNAYSEIRGFLANRGFDWQQGSVYFGDDTVDAVKCVMTIIALSSEYSWFESSVRDIRMLRIQDNNDLMPAVMQGAGKSIGPSTDKRRGKN